MGKYSGQSYHEILKKMAQYCAYQDRCHQEVEKKLNDFVLIPEAKDEILLYLMQNDFLNEERFVKSFVRGKFYHKKWGKIKIELELKKRGIQARLIKIGFSEIDTDDYHKTLADLIHKKSAKTKQSDPYKKRNSIVRYLLQKGYEYEMIEECLDRI